MKKFNLITILSILVLTSCDPTHKIILENVTSKPIVVIYKHITNNETKKTVLGSGQNMEIGFVVARYTPRPEDIEVDFLEVYIEKDTMKLIGKKSIYSAIQKVDKLDWRLIIKDK